MTWKLGASLAAWLSSVLLAAAILDGLLDDPHHAGLTHLLSLTLFVPALWVIWKRV